MSDLEDVNPKVQRLVIGIKESYTISIYPLSVGDELELLNRIGDGLQCIAENTSTLSNSIINTIRLNLPDIINLVVDKSEWAEICPDGTPVLKCMTNKQLNRLVELVYEENFGGSVGKNLQRLMGSLIAAADQIMKVPAPIEPIQPGIPLQG